MSDPRSNESRPTGSRPTGPRGAGEADAHSGKAKRAQRDKLLARVRNLYAMSQETESSPHEAEIALRRCQSLMARFGISEADLETSAFGAADIGRRFRSIPSYVNLLGAGVALLHDCLCVVGETLEFRGYEIDAQVAGLTYGYLAQSMERSLKRRKLEGRVPPGRAASFDYRVGFAAAVLTRCRVIDEERRRAERDAADAQAADARDATRDAQAPSTGLVARKLAAVESGCAEGLETRRARKVRYRDGTAHSAGSSDGDNVSLDSQLTGRRPTLLA